MILRPILSLLAKGRSGVGKTIASCGKEFRPTYVFDFDGRFASVINFYKKLDGHVKDIETDFFPMTTGFYTVDQKFDELIRFNSYKTIVIASLTNYINLVLKHLIDDKKGKKRQSGAEMGKQIAGIRVNELEDYLAEDAAITYELAAFLQDMYNRGTNVILEAHITPYEITTIDPDTRGRENQTINQVLTKGKKAPAQLPTYFNEAYIFEKEFVGFGKEAKHKVNPNGSAVDIDCKTSMGIKPFDWTGKDFSIELWSQLDDSLKSTSRTDPNAPKRVSMK